MAIRLLATYEMVDREDKHLGTVRLPVVGFSEPDEDGREWPRVLLLSGDEPYIVDFHPESSLETPYGTLQGFVVDAVSDPIAAPPGWVAELWVGRIGPEQPRRLGTYPVLAWEPEPQTSWDDYPQGHAVLLVPERDDEIGSHSGPISTRDLPGEARYRSEDDPPFESS
jgi:hypothetical protein